MLYTYNDILNIKKDMQWVIAEIHTNPKLCNNTYLQELAVGIESELWAYDDLLNRISPSEIFDSTKSDYKFLDVTSELIGKIKTNISHI
ncbi:hypothetical protein CRX48_08715 [Morganella morganii]|nr:hypothetical protein CRX48_08715 [Morganella morganii]